MEPGGPSDHSVNRDTKTLHKDGLEESKAPRPVFPLPCLQNPTEVEMFIPFPPLVFPSIAFQAIFSGCPPLAHKVSFRADIP